MQYECKITVIDTKVFTELQEKYLADPKSGSQSRISGTALMMLIRDRRLWTPESMFPI